MGFVWGVGFIEAKAVAVATKRQRYGRKSPSLWRVGLREISCARAAALVYYLNGALNAKLAVVLLLLRLFVGSNIQLLLLVYGRKRERERERSTPDLSLL